MAAVASTASSYTAEDGVPEKFPAGLRVLVVDDDMACLRILEQMLLKCLYRVTICCRATKALSLLRERRGGFDVVISDVHMPDMDGFKLLELVGLEMDLPVIMMSADGRTSAVMRGIKHGACDYLIKPVRIEELKNIWQHVIRKKWIGNKELEHSGSLEDSDRHRRVEDDGEYASSVIDGPDTSWKSQKKKRDVKEEDGELENEDPSTSKKPRVVWSVELHQQFVSAVNQLGIDKAVPKRILELMNVPGLTRENVASHLQQFGENLQKFRLYLKRLSGVAQHQSGLPNPFCGSVETNAKVGSLGRLDIQTLAASGQIPPETLAALHAELLGRPSNCLVLPPIDPPVLLQGSTQGPKCIPFESGVAYGEPLMKCNSNVHKQFPQYSVSLEGVPSGLPNWSSNYPDTTSSANNFSGVNNIQNGNVPVRMLSQQTFPVPSESRHAINVQPSCLVAPSQSSNSLQIGNSPVPVDQNHMAVIPRSTTNFQIGNGLATSSQNCDSNKSSKVVDCSLLSSLSSNKLLDMGQVSDQDFKNVPMLKGYLIPGSISASVSSYSGSTDSSTVSHVHNPAIYVGSTSRVSSLFPSLCAQGSGTNTETLPGQGQGRNLGFVGKGTCIPRRFAVDDIESPTNGISDRKASIINDIDRVKQEFVLDFKDGPKAGNAVLPRGDVTGPLSK